MCLCVALFCKGLNFPFFRENFDKFFAKFSAVGRLQSFFLFRLTLINYLQVIEDNSTAREEKRGYTKEFFFFCKGVCEYVFWENSNDIARKISNEIKKSINRIQECGEELKNDGSEECMRSKEAEPDEISL